MAGFTTKRDIEVSKQQYFRQFERKRDVTLGIVFSVGGSIYVPYTNNKKVWVHEWGSPHSHAQALVGNASVQDGMPVKIAKQPNNPFQWQVMEVYADAANPALEVAQVAQYNTGAHSNKHQVPNVASVGADPVWIWQPALRMLRTTGNGTNLSVTTEPISLTLSSGAPFNFAGAVTDLTSSVPSAGEQRWVLIYLSSTGVLTTLNGTVATDSPSVTPPYPSLPSGGFASAYIRLAGGQTAVNTVSHVQDARSFLGGGSGGGGGVTDFLNLTDTPSSYSGQSLNMVQVNSGETGLEFAAPPSGWPTTFLGLTDTPSSYSGQSLKVVRVNSGETALEFVAGGGDVTGPASATDNAIARFNGTTGKIIQNSGWTIDDFDQLEAFGLRIRGPLLEYWSFDLETPFTGASQPIDADVAAFFDLTINQDTTVTIDMTNIDGQAGIVWVKMDQTGGPWNITWATAGTTLEWPGGTTPDVTQTSGATDLFVFVTFDQGTTVYGKVWGADMQ